MVGPCVEYVLFYSRAINWRGENKWSVPSICPSINKSMQQMTRNGCSMFIECCWDRDLSELSGGMHLDTGSSSANCTFFQPMAYDSKTRAILIPTFGWFHNYSQWYFNCAIYRTWFQGWMAGLSIFYESLMKVLNCKKYVQSGNCILIARIKATVRRTRMTIIYNPHSI